jgi:hypothetical protein
MNRHERRKQDAMARQLGQQLPRPETRPGQILSIQGPIYVTVNDHQVNTPTSFKAGDVVEIHFKPYARPGEPYDVTICYYE